MIALGAPPTDGRGKHVNSARKLPDDTTDCIVDHIKSFKGRKSHYSLSDTRKIYLPNDLTVTKMFELFREKHPNVQCSLETHRTIFTTRFNIGFGYPRKDTCSTCDEMNAKMESFTNETERQACRQALHDHQRTAQVFYDRKAAKR